MSELSKEIKNILDECAKQICGGKPRAIEGITALNSVIINGDTDVAISCLSEQVKFYTKRTKTARKADSQLFANSGKDPCIFLAVCPINTLGGTIMKHDQNTMELWAISPYGYHPKRHP